MGVGKGLANKRFAAFRLPVAPGFITRADDVDRKSYSPLRVVPVLRNLIAL
jgi:hypothetical protein